MDLGYKVRFCLGGEKGMGEGMKEKKETGRKKRREEKRERKRRGGLKDRDARYSTQQPGFKP